ncbi:EAL domain-containing protein [Roseobacter sinensis]|uniref:EAL domain-containing protein n=1 Tax=Roseobacter sinensis TaxID=2931391 RepID=A0ABT3BET2_9RHOB|nr:EAL domain-containing protein [Roseobacter sp. WL0113]MCV3272088.1 EAL domain-containing protein [Roseobacter sp. WL0113]
MSEVSELWILLCGLIVLDLQCGFLCLEAGTVRAKNAGNVALKNISDICCVATVYWVFGFGLMFGASYAGLFGTTGFLPSLDNSTGELAALFFFQLAFAATAATIVSGAVAERERYVGYVLFSLILGGLVYPVIGHWVWGGGVFSGDLGWLQQAGFHDFAGATVVHGVGGWAALVAICVIGPRLGRFTHLKRRFEGSSTALKALGAVFLWIGWGAFNGGSALYFGDAVGPIVARTTIGAAGGGIAAIAICLLVYGYARVDTIINGVLAGLVAGTAGIDIYTAADAFVIGALGACAMVLAVEVLELLRIDDVVAAVPVHLAAGVWGTLAVALFGDLDALPAGSRSAQLLVQVQGILAIGLWVVLVLTPAAILLNRAGLFRATRRDEVRGLNYAENRERNAFADFVRQIRTHQRKGNISHRLAVERSTENGALSASFNGVLDRIEEEIALQLSRLNKEREMRMQVEKSFSALRKVQEESAWAARHDALTGLGNRILLEEVAGSEVSSDGAQILCIAIDLDRFKDVNDSFGHDAGDRVLVATADRIRAKLRKGRDFAFRVGGDEFIVLVEFEGNQTEAQVFCDTLVSDLCEPVAFGLSMLRGGASVGFAIAEQGERSAETRRRADLALYEAKAQGRNCAVAYSSTMGALHEERLDMLRDFKTALGNDEIGVYLQPQVTAVGRDLVGCEVLARWEHPTRGRLAPDVFLPLAEELGLTAALDAKVFDLAINAWSDVARAGIDLPALSVNVSAERLTDPAIVSDIRDAGPFPGRLSVEILETAFLDNISEALRDRLWELKNLGVRIEIDDFGTGHASIAGVLELRPDCLKIDRVFVPGIDQVAERSSLVKGMIEMAQSVGTLVTVEGVETESEAAALVAAGADQLQGYLFGRPMPVDSFIEWAERRAPSESTAAG